MREKKQISLQCVSVAVMSTFRRCFLFALRLLFELINHLFNLLLLLSSSFEVFKVIELVSSWCVQYILSAVVNLGQTWQMMAQLGKWRVIGPTPPHLFQDSWILQHFAPIYWLSLLCKRASSETGNSVTFLMHLGTFRTLE